MTRLLASVQDEHEALIALEGGASIIDFKNARAGALAALDPHLIADALRRLDGRAITSATAGDWPLDPAAIAQAAMRMGATGVEYVKVGLLPGAELMHCIKALAPAATQYRLVAVFFADRGVPLDMLRHLHIARFAGAMVDTFDKSGGGLRQHMSDRALKAFIDTAHDFELHTGLAGSLRTDDIDALTGLAPNFLGFRGALCARSDRRSGLSARRLRLVREELDRACTRHACGDPCSLSLK